MGSRGYLTWLMQRYRGTNGDRKLNKDFNTIDPSMKARAGSGSTAHPRHASAKMN